MRAKWATFYVMIIVSILLVALSIKPKSNSVPLMQTHATMISMSEIQTPVSSLKTTVDRSNQNGIIDWNDSNIKAAIIGGMFTMLAAILAAILGIIHSVRLNKRNHLLNLELEQFKKKSDENLLNLKLEARAKIREKSKLEKEAEAARIAMEQAKSVEELAQAYRDSLLADQRISGLQILGMSKPLKVENVYVRVRVHQDETLNADLDPELRRIENLRDPDILLKIERRGRENRVNSVLTLEPDEAIRNNSRCVILGDAGAGKTTLLKYLALKSAQGQLSNLPYLPIFIELKKFINFNSPDLLDFTATQWFEDYGFPKDTARIYMEDNLKAGKTLLLLDGLDETIVGDTQEEAEATYQRVVNAILKLSTRYYQSPMVVTARKAGYKQRKSLAGFTEIEVANFSPEDITKFINNWLSASQNQQESLNAEKLIKRIERNPRFHELASNPLLLSLMVIFYKAYHDLPERRADLYQRCVEILLVEWDTKREIHRRHEFNSERTRQLLAEIAWEFHNKGRYYFPESDLLDIIANFLIAIEKPVQEKNQVLTEIEDMHGLLKPQAWRWHGFLHLTFQEYFVVDYIIANNKLETLLTYHLGDPWWEEIILLYAARVSDASPLLLTLLELDGKDHLREDIFYTNLILAGRCLIDQPTVKQNFLREEIVSRLSKILLSTSYSLTKVQIMNVLTAISGQKINNFLLSTLTDEACDQNLRWKIAEALGTVGDPSITSTLVDTLSNTKSDQLLRQTIAEALGMSGDRSIVIDLLRLVSSTDKELDVQRSIIKAIGQLGDQKATYELLNLLSNPRVNVYVRCTAAEALSSLEESSIVPNLLVLLTNKHTHYLVQASIATSLGVLGNQSIVPQLAALIIDEQTHQIVCYRIVDTIGRLNGRDKTEMRKLSSDTRIAINVRNYITVVLGRLGDELVIPDLLNMLSDAGIDVYVRRNAADALSIVGNRALVFDLLKQLANARLDRNVRMSIVYTLGKLGDHSIVTHLLNILIDPQIDSYIRRSSAEALGAMGDTSVVPTLLSLLNDVKIDSRTRQIIAKVLGNLASDKETVEALATLLSIPAIADNIHSAMWSVSRRARVRVFSISEPVGDKLLVEGYDRLQ